MPSKLERRKKIQMGIRHKVSGTSSRPRLSVFRSNKGIYCQLIDDVNMVTLASASSKDVKGANNTEIATAVGTAIAAQAVGRNIENVVFDRSGYLYHGRVKALAEAARSGGLKF